MLRLSLKFFESLSISFDNFNSLIYDERSFSDVIPFEEWYFTPKINWKLDSLQNQVFH